MEAECAPHYAELMGRPSLAPGEYFRLLLVGYFEGIDSEPGIAWRLADSLTLREFLGYGVTDLTPDHSTISRNRRRIPTESHARVFSWVLEVMTNGGLVKGKKVGVDATTLEANAALRSIVRRDTGDSYHDFLEQLARKSGIETPTRQDLAKLDKGRKKKGSNDEWKHPHDPDARITKMGAVLEQGHERSIRTYISEPARGRRKWRPKQELQKLTYANRRRTRGSHGQSLMRQRGEKIVRGFAHCYETGALRRLHVRGRDNVLQRALVNVAAHNLGILMREKLGHGTPRALQGLLRHFWRLLVTLRSLCDSFFVTSAPVRHISRPRPRSCPKLQKSRPLSRRTTYTTGC